VSAVLRITDEVTVWHQYTLTEKGAVTAARNDTLNNAGTRGTDGFASARNNAGYVNRLSSAAMQCATMLQVARLFLDPNGQVNENTSAFRSVPSKCDAWNAKRSQ
jgi:hypothetical protein